jgi:hypothetical protein
VTATRYVTPLKEGGSLPAIMEADDDGLYVVKFRAAGQGPKALVAEIVAGEIGRRGAAGAGAGRRGHGHRARRRGPTRGRVLLEAAAPEAQRARLPARLLPTARVDPGLARTRLRTSSGSTRSSRTSTGPPRTQPARLAPQPVAIDHGAALYVQHTWREPAATPGGFAQAKDHICCRSPVGRGRGRPPGDRLDRPFLEQVLAAVPDRWLSEPRRLRGLPADGGAPPSWRGGACPVRPPQRPRRPFGPWSGPVPVRRGAWCPRVERGEGFNAGVIVFCRPPLPGPRPPR